MIDDENIYYDEFLQYIRARESHYLEELWKNGKLHEYILNLNKEMIDKYPEMIVKVYTREEIDEEGMNNV